jgi:hypothetical protein
MRYCLLKRPADFFKEDFGPLDYGALAGIRFGERDAAACATVRLERRQAGTPDLPGQPHTLLAIRTAWVASLLHFTIVASRLADTLICIKHHGNDPTREASRLGVSAWFARFLNSPKPGRSFERRPIPCVRFCLSEDERRETSLPRLLHLAPGAAEDLSTLKP